jgi:predicted ATP-dependent endonuclease of OLD family
VRRSPAPLSEEFIVAQNRVLLTKLSISNFGPIKEDKIELDAFTYFVGRNNAGKSHYLKAVELLLSSKAPGAEEILKLQNDKMKPIIIEGVFEGVENYVAQVTKSNHREAIERAIANGRLTVVRTLQSQETESSDFGIFTPSSGEVFNPSGFPGNLLKILPEPISIVATADTLDELKSKGNTAISKLKREVLGSFLAQLETVSKDAFASVAEFLHSKEEGKRSPDLVKFEADLRAELDGEFSNIKPSLEFELPGFEVISQDVKLLLDDGHPCEVEQKGHGLQRATLLALLRLLAKQGGRYRGKPAPIFLIGELETFLHPYAQKQLGGTLSKLAEDYQILTTTHSPFIVSPITLKGYRRVCKGDSGTVNTKADWNGLDDRAVKKHFEWRGNLEGLFADRVILTEGDGDEFFYEKLTEIFGISPLIGKFTIFVKMNGNKGLAQIREFYRRIGVEDVSAIVDLDWAFSNQVKPLLSSLGIDQRLVDMLREHLRWDSAKDPKLKDVVGLISQVGEPPQLMELLESLKLHRIFVLRNGAPEHYSMNFPGQKEMLLLINDVGDLREPQYLADLVRSAVLG